jgi:predicted amino acid racemase
LPNTTLGEGFGRRAMVRDEGFGRRAMVRDEGFATLMV